MTSIYELKMGAEKLEALKFLLSQIKDLEAAVKSIDVNELREFRYLAQKMQGLESDVAKSKELIEKAKNDLAPLAADVERVGKAAKDEIDIKAQTFNASLARKAEEFEQIKSNFESKYAELAALKTRIEDALKSVSSPIDDEATATNTTFSSRKIEDTFAKKSEAADVSTLATKEELNTKIGETRANELITAKTANLATKEELNAKLDAEAYNSQKANYATKTEVTNALQNKADATALQSAVTSLQSEITTKISQAASGGVTRDYVKNFTKAVSVSSATIYFSSGINFYLDNPSGGPVLKAGDLTNPDNFGKSGLVYINGTSIQSLSSDFVPINPDEATFSKGYVFFSYFFHPVQRKIIVQYLKDSTI